MSDYFYLIEIHCVGKTKSLEKWKNKKTRHDILMAVEKRFFFVFRVCDFDHVQFVVGGGLL